jgi:2-(1,2-epoxy-1,2-dihydrophenyl)acetyl-CoA isomerase
MAQFETLLYEEADGVARVTLNRPDVHNAFNRQMQRELRDLWRSLRRNDDVRVVILTGAGDQAFCTGIDRAEAISQARSPQQREKLSESGSTPFTFDNPGQNVGPKACDLWKPVIAAVNGVAAGAGASIALACDLVIAAKSASFIQAFSRLGLVPDSGATWFLPRLVGSARALGLAMLGERLPAEQAAAWGLIWRCVDDADFAAAIDRLASELAAAPTRGLVRTREALRAAATATLAEQLDRERDLQRELGYTDDYAEGVAAFSEKRAPRFTEH